MEDDARWPSKLQNFIDGEYRDPLSKKYVDSYEPATGKVIFQLPDSNAADVDAAVAAAVIAFKTPAWRSMSRKQRSSLLLRIADLIDARRDELAFAESTDQGKPVHVAKQVDIPRAALNFRHFATFLLHETTGAHPSDSVSHVAPLTEDDSPSEHAHFHVIRTPVGVAGLISPWNLPLYLLTWKIAPALAAGNTVVCKPSEMTSLTAYLLCDIMQEAGVPSGVFNIVFGTGPNAGAPLVQHPKVPLISFTGGTVTGERIMKDSAPLIKKLSLELGGKNASLVFEDCDFHKCIATSIRAAFSNQGEICLCASRIFVQRSIYDKFVEAFVLAAKALKVGDPRDPSSNLGALISEAHMNRILEFIGSAREEGGTILCGGSKFTVNNERCPQGWFISPTVIVDAPPTSRAMQEEIFGPVVNIWPFDTEHEAISLANNVKYGLSACVWTNQLQRAHRVSRQMEAGNIWVNCWMVRDLDLPFGGMKLSGIGREGGQHSFDFFTEQKAICIASE